MKAVQYQWNIAGHENQVFLLQSALRAGSLSHAYLFFGPKHIGKRHISDYFVASLLCVSADSSKPCMNCQQCSSFFKKKHPDVITVHGNGVVGSITIDEVRSFRDSLFLRPVLGAYRIGIIYESENLNTTSANALLKIFEEAPQSTIIILIANRIDGLPGTLCSRAQLLKFSPFPVATMDAWMRDQGLEESLSRAIAKIAAGRIPVAQKMIDDNLESYRSLVTQTIEFIRSSKVDKILYVDDLLKTIKGQDRTVKQADIIHQTTEFVDALESLLRDAAILKIGSGDIRNVLYQEQIQGIAQRVSLDSIYRYLAALDGVRHALARNANVQLIYENLFVSN